MIEWRWDQGRVLYFQFDVIREIAKVLVLYENKNINDSFINEEFRSTLMKQVGLPFAPSDYKVNRNYGRVFQCALLARYNDNSFYVSDLCKLLSKKDSIFSNCDDYLYEVAKRFRYPFPAFQDYDAISPRVYPFCAVIKYLLAKREMGVESKIDINEICSYIIGNECTGVEDIDFYKQLKPTGYVVINDGLRQIREMLAFLSQFSFLKAFGGYLYLDINGNEDIQFILDNISLSVNTTPLSNRAEEFRQLTTTNILLPPHKLRPPTLDISDIEFTEGKKIRVQHIKVERSPLLRKFYIATHPEPVCSACEMHIKQKYPWVDYMLEIHHLLPLASIIKISNEGTSLNDLVGLCPSCHRAIHTYYRKWLKSNNQEDFKSKKEAMTVYLDAVREIA